MYGPTILVFHLGGKKAEATDFAIYDRNFNLGMLKISLLIQKISESTVFKRVKLLVSVRITWNQAAVVSKRKHSLKYKIEPHIK